MAAAAAASLKRPAPGGSPAAATGTKRRRFMFGSIDDYEMLEELGNGTNGVVRKALDRRTGKKVAIKCFHDAPDREVIREAFCQAVCRGDPAIVEMKDLAEDARTGDKFLVMELVVGDTLRDNIWWTGKPEEITRPVMRKLVGAAKKMHDAGIIHRDLKPENVLCGMQGGLKICDFGSATRVKPAGEPYEEGPVGTSIYNSPELIMDSRCYGTAVDMWALGCIMFELLTGGPLLDDEDGDLPAQVSALRDKIAEHGTSAFEDLEELSEAGREVLVGLLAFNPDERLTAAAALEQRWFMEAKPAAKHPGFVLLPLGPDS